MRILFLANNDVGLYNFRYELIERLISQNHQVFISCPNGSRIVDFVRIGALYSEINIQRHGTNPFRDFKLVKQYKSLIKSIKPNIIFSYTIKPNIYGAIAARRCGVPFVANITGLGSAVETKGLKQKICISLYKYAFRSVRKVFFQNEANKLFFVDHKIKVLNSDVLPGSGVNLSKYHPLSYPSDEIIRFAFVGRITKEKGIDYYLESVNEIRKKYKNVEFHICGFIEKEYCGPLKEYIDSGAVIYHGMVNNMESIYSIIHCVVLPSYYPEGMSNVLLEAAACARPIITTDRPGCKETVDDGLSGFVIPTKNQDSLTRAIEKVILMNNVERTNMGICGRHKMEREFDRQIIINKYLEELK